MLTCDAYLTPETLHDALAAWSAAPEGSRLLAGATDTLPWARQGRGGDVAGDVHVPTIVDISRVVGLDGHEFTESGHIRLGANVVFQDFLEDPGLREHLPHLAPCALWFADDQIRRQATIAGNVVNASPAADGTPPLLTAEAMVEIARMDGDHIVWRSVPLASFVEGPGRTGIARGEIVTGITCESLKGYGGAFEKVGHRRSLVISVVCASCAVKPTADGRAFADVRLALGGIGPVPVRLDEVETFLRGKPATSDVIAEAAALPVDRVASRTRREYRREVVRGFVARAVATALAAAAPGTSAKTDRKLAHG